MVSTTILITGKVFSGSIPIGADIEPVSITTRIFIISTIVARVAVGIKASMGSVLPEPLALGNIPDSLVLANILELLALGNVLELLALGNIPDSPVLANIPEPLDLVSSSRSYWSWRPSFRSHWSRTTSRRYWTWATSRNRWSWCSFTWHYRPWCPCPRSLWTWTTSRSRWSWWPET